MSQLVITTASGNKKPGALCKEVLSHFLIKQLSHFVIISIAFCNKVPS